MYHELQRHRSMPLIKTRQQWSEQAGTMRPNWTTNLVLRIAELGRRTQMTIAQQSPTLYWVAWVAMAAWVLNVRLMALHLTHLDA